MSSYLPQFFTHALQSTFSNSPRPGLSPIPGTSPITLEAALCPPLVYYIALLFLAPPPPTIIESHAAKALRVILALTAGVLFFRLPLAYHVPQSIGLTYQLGLVGLYGGCRAIDAFFISPVLFGHIPRRVRYTHVRAGSTPQKEKPNPLDTNADTSADKRARRGSLDRTMAQSDLLENMSNDSYTALVQRLLAGPNGIPVTETSVAEDGWPHTFADRASWALELELSMRGVGFTWTTADVRHTRRTWLPTVRDRVHSIVVHVGPVLLVSWAVIKHMYVTHLSAEAGAPTGLDASPFDDCLSLPQKLLLTGCLGAFLMAAFSLAHSVAAIACAPLAPSPLAYFPALYTARIWSITSVRGFWSYGWHRLFARLFLVYGVWPGEALERMLTGKGKGERCDIGKVLGGFLSSAFVHSFAVRGVLGGRWDIATGEARFFALNGLAVVFEGGVQRVVRRWRRSSGLPADMWYDGIIGRVWWIAVLLGSGTNFARGWTRAGLVREMAFM